MGCYKHKNGKWYCRGRINGERYHLPCAGAKNKEEAKALEDAERYKIRQRQAGLLTTNENYTFDFMMQKYIDTRTANNTNLKDAKTYRKKLTEYFGKNKKILCIKPVDIEAFKKYMLDKGKKESTVNRHLVALKRAYNIMIENELINYNPMKKVKLLCENNKRYRYLTKSEWKRLQLTLPDSIRTIVFVALLTGLRKSNILNLRWEQIDFRLRLIEILPHDNKGKKHILLPMSDALMDILQSIRPKEKGYLFPNPKTGLPYTDIHKSFESALKKAQITDFHFHDLRRTVGTWLLQEGVDIRTIQGILCHSEVSTTERYLAITPESNKKAMNTLDRYMLQ